MLQKYQLITCISAGSPPSNFSLSCGLDIWYTATGTLNGVSELMAAWQPAVISALEK